MDLAQDELDRYRTLLDVAGAIVSHAELPALVRDLVRLLPRLVPVNFVGIALHDAATNRMRLHTLQANVPAEIVGGHETELDDSPAGLVWRTQQPFFLDELEGDARWPKVLSLMRADGIRSLCMVPLTSPSTRLGVLTLAGCRPADYDHDDGDLLQQIGRQVAVAVENVLNREAAAASQQVVERRRDRFALLLDLTKTMAASLELREVFRAINARLRSLMAHDYASLLLYDRTRDRVTLHALDFPGNPSLLAEGRESTAEGSPAGRALTEQHPVLANDRETLRAFPHPVMQLLCDQGIAALCAFPLIARGRVIGCLNVASRVEGAFTEADVEFLDQVAGQIALAVDNASAYQEISALKDKVTEEKLYLEDELRSEHGFDEIMGDSAALARVLAQVEVVAPTDSTVLIQGETGTGKELIARAIHRLSGRGARTLVKLNCAAIPTGLLESELFGHERGAFTGAISQKLGRFELADGGTIFLDEVGEIPVELQSKLLRVLQEQEFERLGGTRTIRVNVRLIAATNRDLEALVEAKQFRSDLYYRLNVFPVVMPPLRERREDIPILVRYFAQHYATRMKKTIDMVPSKALEALTRYHWPGNVRELENLVERAVILTQGSQLHIPLEALRLEDPSIMSSTATLEETERAQILHVLRETKWVIGGPTGAAARLGVKRTTLTSKLSKLGIHRPTG